MLRAIGVFGFGAVFLAISPGLRGDISGVLSAGFVHAYVGLSYYSPLSYVGLGVVLIAGLMFMVRRAVQPR
jgi:hypothetical protein